MNIRARLPALILFAIILSGGFGIVRMTFVRHDLIGMSAIIVALVLTGVFKRLATSKHPYAGRAMGLTQSKWPINLASAASDSFEVFPGRPEGYAGYTDYTAMSVDVNDDLATRQPAEQYALLGFGNGFLKGIRERLADGEGYGRSHFHVIDAARKYKESIGWLAYLQRSGTDNSGPSTENLHSVIQCLSTVVGSKGPITMKFWDKVHNKQSESLQASGTSPKMLEEWTDIYQAAFVDGQRQALSAAL
jgi:hypothetical protein